MILYIKVIKMSKKKQKSSFFHPVLRALGIKKKQKSYFPSMQPLKKYKKKN